MSNLKVVNVSDKPFEFLFNAVVYVVPPGKPVELPYEIAMHGIKKSVFYDPQDDNVLLGHKLELLDTVKSDAQAMAALMKYECPFTASDQCNAGLFDSIDDLRAHLESVHWPVDAVEDPTEPIMSSPSASIGLAATKTK